MKDISEIKEELAKLRQVTFHQYQYWVGHRFSLHIFTNSVQDMGGLENTDDTIMNYSKVDVTLMEWSKDGSGGSLRLIEDPRFKDYEPIQYDVINSPGGRINMSTGYEMPIHNLCELIRYLYRLNNLSAFE